jgi:hypothetical protein
MLQHLVNTWGTAAHPTVVGTLIVSVIAIATTIATTVTTTTGTIIDVVIPPMTGKGTVIPTEERENLGINAVPLIEEGIVPLLVPGGDAATVGVLHVEVEVALLKLGMMEAIQMALRMPMEGGKPVCRLEAV